MNKEYKQTLRGILKIITGLIVGVALGWVFTRATEIFFDIINLEERL